MIVDTAGRLAVDQAMMEEIRALHAALHPIETLFVVDSMQGQDAVNVAKAFADALPLTGVVLTKLDGDARGGAALSVRHVVGRPIKFVGVGEKLANLEPFHPERMASRILGMGDVLSLVEDARRNVDLDEAEKLAKKVKSGKGFDLEDFKSQMLQMNKMGGLGALMDKLPAQLTQMAQGANVDEKIINRTIGIINSMTPAERAKPELIKASAAAPSRWRRAHLHQLVARSTTTYTSTDQSGTRQRVRDQRSHCPLESARRDRRRDASRLYGRLGTSTRATSRRRKEPTCIRYVTKYVTNYLADTAAGDSQQRTSTGSRRTIHPACSPTCANWLSTASTTAKAGCAQAADRGRLRG